MWGDVPFRILDRETRPPVPPAVALVVLKLRCASRTGWARRVAEARAVLAAVNAALASAINVTDFLPDVGMSWSSEVMKCS